ncbi:ketopantoate reductase family protein [Streptomyces sp. NPDC127051]|uniref:ketopantoate reductase family protein n=1 Tax=Streptomyces sp. NPDC127051 TaxID=3347119 RepID=UPI003668D90B
MRILTVGAGAVGGWFGARLARAGQDVTFLVRRERAAVLRERGLRVTGLGEDLALTPELVTADALSRPYDLVLLSVKSTALDRAAKDLAPAVGPGTAIVPLLNGMAHLEHLRDRFGGAPVLGGVAKVVTTLNEHGDIVRMAPPSTVITGELDGRTSARVDAVRALLSGAGIDSPEAAAVSAAAGHPVPDAELAFTARTVTTPGSPLTPSMYRDLVAGRPTEVEHVFGDLIARARALAVHTPLLDLATLQLRVHQRRMSPEA